MSDANSIQHGGTHYKIKAIQPWDFIAANDIGFFEGNAIKYLTRWRDKGGIEDIKKARHYVDKLIEIEHANLGFRLNAASQVQLHQKIRTGQDLVDCIATDFWPPSDSDALSWFRADDVLWCASKTLRRVGLVDEAAEIADLSVLAMERGYLAKPMQIQRLLRHQAIGLTMEDA